MEVSSNKENEIYKVLEQCFDPELPNISVMDLGLIYDVIVQNNRVLVKMTLTTPGCGLAQMMIEQIKTMIRDLPWVESAEVELVWDPPWHPDRMNEKAKKILGFDQ